MMSAARPHRKAIRGVDRHTTEMSVVLGFAKRPADAAARDDRFRHWLGASVAIALATVRDSRSNGLPRNLAPSVVAPEERHTVCDLLLGPSSF